MEFVCYMLKKYELVDQDLLQGFIENFRYGHLRTKNLEHVDFVLPSTLYSRYCSIKFDCLLPENHLVTCLRFQTYQNIETLSSELLTFSISVLIVFVFFLEI